jgi:hypothetical protein
VLTLGRPSASRRYANLLTVAIFYHFDVLSYTALQSLLSLYGVTKDDAMYSPKIYICAMLLLDFISLHTMPFATT